jgi:S1-C subfamily serine protease
MNLKKIIESKAFQIAAVAVIGLAVGFFGGRVLTRSSSRPTVPEGLVYTKEPAEAGEGFQTINNIQAAFREVARQVLPSVVEIDVVNVVKAQLPGIDSPFDFFFAPGSPNGQPKQQEFRQEGLGSGVLVKRAGRSVYVLTNNHVVGEAQEITVKLSDGRSYTAKLVGKDPKKDLALVAFTTEESVPLAVLGDSDALQVGDWVLAVGSPLGFHSSVTEGIVSAIGRESLPGSSIASFTDYIQTDAAINQGNSGGALVDIQAAMSDLVLPSPSITPNRRSRISSPRAELPTAGWVSIWVPCPRRRRKACMERRYRVPLCPACTRALRQKRMVSFPEIRLPLSMERKLAIPHSFFWLWET